MMENEAATLSLGGEC